MFTILRCNNNFPPVVCNAAAEKQLTTETEKYLVWQTIAMTTFADGVGGDESLFRETKRGGSAGGILFAQSN